MSARSEAPVGAPRSFHASATAHDDQIERLIGRLPHRVQTATRWLRRPSSRWVRIPAGVLLIFGSLLSILPLFGIWMLPLGLLLLAEDVSALRRLRRRLLDAIERRRPDWLEGKSAGTAPAAPAPDASRSHSH